MVSSSVAAAAATSTTTKTKRTTTKSRGSGSFLWNSLLRCRWVLDLPLCLSCVALLLAMGVHRLYHQEFQHLVKSLSLDGITDERGLYPMLDSHITYYNRLCTAEDISTTDSNDLVVGLASSNTTTTTTTTTSSNNNNNNNNNTSNKATVQQTAADTMMTHGAVILPNMLSLNTAQTLRDYLETRHEIDQDKHLELDWAHEKFWGEIGRLSLGLGVNDHPIIGKALEEVGNHKVLQQTLEGIVGKNPAVVEISTLTTMHGAEAQGIHTDSDYFGSSLLYSRTFLHSYTLFIALQDTTSRMGATTVCPGTHMCANEDLEDVCMNNGAFEVSSNGLTGKDVGLLSTGDGMMFNQNIWHRGPRNFDVDFPINRVMFIVTFVSRREHALGDVRIQGMGTYYYQRWNMWGHTLEDLKHASTRMTQPYAALKALGVYQKGAFQQPQHQQNNWGIPWLEHFARQLGNQMDFYADYELPELVRYLNRKLPSRLHFLLPKRNEFEPWLDDEGVSAWDAYLRRLFENTKEFCQNVYGIVVALYLGVQIVVALLVATIVRSSSSRSSSSFASFVRYLSSLAQRFLVVHAWIGVLAGAVWYGLSRSYLMQRIESRAVDRAPFPLFEDPTTGGEGPVRTTVPERMDVLIGSRLDANFLGIYNRILDYHPGNQRFQRIVQECASTTTTTSMELKVLAVQQALFQPVKGVVPRMLEQSYVNGHWSILLKDAMGNDSAITTAATTEISQTTVIHRALQMEESPWKLAVEGHLKGVLADGRFGTKRDTAMSRRFTPFFVSKWENVVFGTPSVLPAYNKALSPSLTWTPISITTIHGKVPGIKPNMDSKVLRIGMTSSRILLESFASTTNNSTNSNKVRVGDRILVNRRWQGQYMEATITSILDAHWCWIEFAIGGMERAHVDQLRKYQSIVQGDMIEFEFEDNEWFPYEVLLAHPLGTYDLRYAQDGEEETADYISRDSLRLMHMDPVELEWDDDKDVVTSTATAPELLEPGQRIEANFQGEGEWFDAVVSRVNDPRGRTYAVSYLDGDFEPTVPREFIRVL